MKTGRNLQEVLVELNRQNKAKQDFISPAQGMRLREDGHTFEINHLTTSQQEVFGTTSLFHRQVASALGIPAKYYRIIATYIKCADEDAFNQIIYRAKKIEYDKLKYPDDWGSLPRLEAENNTGIDSTK